LLKHERETGGQKSNLCARTARVRETLFFILGLSTRHFLRGGEKYTKVFLGPGKKYPLITRATSAAAAAACDAFAYLAEEEVTPPPRVVMILRDHPSKK
jgi:hypothetical protein